MKWWKKLTSHGLQSNKYGVLWCNQCLILGCKRISVRLDEVDAASALASLPAACLTASLFLVGVGPRSELELCQRNVFGLSGNSISAEHSIDLCILYNSCAACTMYLHNVHAVITLRSHYMWLINHCYSAMFVWKSVLHHCISKIFEVGMKQKFNNHKTAKCPWKFLKLSGNSTADWKRNFN